MIAGGASWPHWLAGTSVEGMRWLDDAFASGADVSDRAGDRWSDGPSGAVSDAARAMALTGRGLLHFQLGRPGVDDDLEAALAICRRSDDVAGMALAYSFYAEVAASRGETDLARRRRLEVLEFYLGLPDSPFVLGARAYSQAKIAMLDGDLAAAERGYRTAADGFSRTDRPMMRTMCLGMIADFDERRGDFTAAVANLSDAIEINHTLGLRGFNGALLGRQAWVLLHSGDVAGAQVACTRALDIARRLDHRLAIFIALAADAVLHRCHGRNEAAAAAAAEALELHLAGAPQGLSNRVDRRADTVSAVTACCVVLAGCAADAGAGDAAARLLGRAEALGSEAAVPALPFQRADGERAREVASSLLGEDAFSTAFEIGRHGQLGHEVPVRL
jgi:tetratricopeptide (TPR) repeat protein